MLRDQLQTDLKTAMIAKDTLRLETLRGLKTAIQYADVAKGQTEPIDDAAIQNLFAREAKKRQESADLYEQGGSPEQAAKELAEKTIIDTYLPKQLTATEVADLIDEAVTTTGASSPQDMGRVIGAVKARAGNAADGALVARLVKERLSKS